MNAYIVSKIDVIRFDGLYGHSCEDFFEVVSRSNDVSVRESILQLEKPGQKLIFVEPRNDQI
jgi:hypothetical protein